MNITTYYMNILSKLNPQLFSKAKEFADNHSDADAYHVDVDFPIDEIKRSINKSRRPNESTEKWIFTDKNLPKDGCICWICTKDNLIAPAKFSLRSFATQGRSDRRAFECSFCCKAYPVSEVVSWAYMKRPTYPYPGNIACV